MFTARGFAAIELAKDLAYVRGSSLLDVDSLLAALLYDAATAVLLAEGLGASIAALRDAALGDDRPVRCPTSLRLTPEARAIIERAREFAADVPDAEHPGSIDTTHLVAATLVTPATCAALGGTALDPEAVVVMLARWVQGELLTTRIDDLAGRLRELNASLLSRVFGQDHAVRAFVEGLFNAEVVAGVDSQRRQPRAVFVFAGPPGVGKTFLAEAGAAVLGRPFQRFDMSAYSDHQAGVTLIGMHQGYQNAHPGQLTDFVAKNPDAILLFDEIERAHLNTIQLFLQLLDAGMLEDKYTEQNVSFRDTIVIFTTNAGRTLYDRPNSSGVHRANAAFCRQTILEAIASEKSPTTGLPIFPSAICSRMASGWPVMFNYLGVTDLARVASAELQRVSSLLERQYLKQVDFDEQLPLLLVLREGPGADARTLRAQTESFVKTELYNFCQLFRTDRLEEAFQQVTRMRFVVELDGGGGPSAVADLLEPPARPRILLVAEAGLGRFYQQVIPTIEWRVAATVDEALAALSERDYDLVLLDIWLGRAVDRGATVLHFDYAPAASRGLERGQELLRAIHTRFEETPVYLLALCRENTVGEQQVTVDEALFTACVRAGGARGVVESALLSTEADDWEEARDAFVQAVQEIARRLHRERSVGELHRERMVLAFDTVPKLRKADTEALLRIRNLRLTRAVAAADAGEVVDDVERPRQKFDDVIGATAAKEELQFFIDYLRDPRSFGARGLRPPRGVLLYGPPGTGKTMLARALAGESDVAFLSASGSAFVTIWQGSGPQNIRDLFQRARRYAPAIVFIDEIDAIGKTRTGIDGTRAEENTLNALLTEMDGFAGQPANRPVFVLAATNFPIAASGRHQSSLDPALTRRFDRLIQVDLPDRAARQLYLQRKLAGLAASQVTEAMMEQIARQSHGSSLADLEHVIEAAMRQALRQGGTITDAILDECFQTFRHGERKVWDDDLLRRVALHESGHTVLSWLGGRLPLYVTVVARGEHGGYMERAIEEVERTLMTRDEILATIRTLLGGRAAELICFGADGGLSTGFAGDLEMATQLARRLICEWGMSDEVGMLALSPAESMTGPLALKVNEAVSALLRQQMDLTVQLLSQHRAHLEQLADALCERNRLGTSEMEAILGPPPVKRAAASEG